MLEKLLSQSTEQDNPSRLVIEAAHGSASKVRELVQKYPDKVSAAFRPLLLTSSSLHRGGGRRAGNDAGDVPRLNTLLHPWSIFS